MIYRLKFFASFMYLYRWTLHNYDIGPLFEHAHAVINAFISDIIIRIYSTLLGVPILYMTSCTLHLPRPLLLA